MLPGSIFPYPYVPRSLCSPIPHLHQSSLNLRRAKSRAANHMAKWRCNPYVPQYGYLQNPLDPQPSTLDLQPLDPQLPPPSTPRPTTPRSTTSANLKSFSFTKVKLCRLVPSLCSEDSMFRRVYIPKVLCSEGSIFRRFYNPKVLCSEGSMFRMSIIGTTTHWS